MGIEGPGKKLVETGKNSAGYPEYEFKPSNPAVEQVTDEVLGEESEFDVVKYTKYGPELRRKGKYLVNESVDISSEFTGELRELNPDEQRVLRDTIREVRGEV